MIYLYEENMRRVQSGLNQAFGLKVLSTKNYLRLTVLF